MGLTMVGSATCLRDTSRSAISRSCSKSMTVKVKIYFRTGEILEGTMLEIVAGPVLTATEVS